MNSMFQCHKTDTIILSHYRFMLSYLKFPRRRPICIMFFFNCLFFVVFLLFFRFISNILTTKTSYKNNSKNYFCNRKKNSNNNRKTQAQAHKKPNKKSNINPLSHPNFQSDSTSQTHTVLNEVIITAIYSFFGHFYSEHVNFLLIIKRCTFFPFFPLT